MSEPLANGSGRTSRRGETGVSAEQCLAELLPKLGRPPGISHHSENQTKANHSHPLVLLPVTPHLLLLLSDNMWLSEAPLAYGGWLGEEGRGGHGI